MTERPVHVIEVSFYQTDVEPQVLFDDLEAFINERHPGFSGVISMHKENTMTDIDNTKTEPTMTEPTMTEAFKLWFLRWEPTEAEVNTLIDWSGKQREAQQDRAGRRAPLCEDEGCDNYGMPHVCNIVLPVTAQFRPTAFTGAAAQVRREQAPLRDMLKNYRSPAKEAP